MKLETKQSFNRFRILVRMPKLKNFFGDTWVHALKPNGLSQLRYDPVGRFTAY